jgi:hypothetical protein
MARALDAQPPRLALIALPFGLAQMNSGTSSPLASSSVSVGSGELLHARTATARLPSNTSPGWRPAQSSQLIPLCDRIPSVPARGSRIGFSMPPEPSIDGCTPRMRENSSEAVGGCDRSGMGAKWCLDLPTRCLPRSSTRKGRAIGAQPR